MLLLGGVLWIWRYPRKVGKSREAIARMRRHYGGVFAGEMGVFFGEILEVIAKHFNFEKSIY